ncbi:MAG: recombinase family protein [Gemmatimonadales bacterium]|nr:MAG: recombinase family protein [Gemmatimonadales bacterium]
MTEFTNWRHRLEAQGGVVPDRVRVTRKSSRENHKQQFSHDQQIAAMEKEWGSVDPAWCWEESRSGTSFDRPGFQDLLDFCKSNPPPNGKGRVEWWAPHRFGRILDRNGEPDILAFISVYNDFEQANWELHFLTVPRTGNGLADVVNIAVHAYAAAVYSKDLSENVTRGRRSEGRNGWWVNGQAPWGTLRMDTKEQSVLKPGENSMPGGGGTVLVEDPDVLPFWSKAAEFHRRRVIQGNRRGPVQTRIAWATGGLAWAPAYQELPDKSAPHRGSESEGRRRQCGVASGAMGRSG